MKKFLAFCAALVLGICIFAGCTNENVYKVTFNVGDDVSGAPTEQKIVGGERVVVPADPAKTGATFAGWFEDSTCLTAFDFSKPIEKDVVIYAKWETAASNTSTTNSNVNYRGMNYNNGGYANMSNQNRQNNYPATNLTSNSNSNANTTTPSNTNNIKSANQNTNNISTANNGNLSTSNLSSSSNAGVSTARTNVATSNLAGSNMASATNSGNMNTTNANSNSSNITDVANSNTTSNRPYFGRRGILRENRRGSNEIGNLQTRRPVGDGFATTSSEAIINEQNGVNSRYFVNYVNGTDSTREIVFAGDRLTKMYPSQAMIGKTFLGWYLDENYTIPYEDGMEITANINLYAKWSDADMSVVNSTNSANLTSTSSNLSTRNLSSTNSARNTSVSSNSNMTSGSSTSRRVA